VVESVYFKVTPKAVAIEGSGLYTDMKYSAIQLLPFAKLIKPVVTTGQKSEAPSQKPTTVGSGKKEQPRPLKSLCDRDFCGTEESFIERFKSVASKIDTSILGRINAKLKDLPRSEVEIPFRDVYSKLSAVEIVQIMSVVPHTAKILKSLEERPEIQQWIKNIGYPFPEALAVKPPGSKDQGQ